MKNLTIAALLGIATATTGIAIDSAPARAVIITCAGTGSRSCTGKLADANDLVSIPFTIASASNVTLRSYGYGGSGSGTNYDGNTISAGGFDPNITIFDSSNKWLVDSDDTPSGDLDFNFSTILPAGNYRAVLAVFGNLTNGSGSTYPGGYPNAGDFFSGSTDYAVDIIFTPVATAVPEPSSLIGTAIAGFSTVLVRRKLASDRQKNRS